MFNIFSGEKPFLPWDTLKALFAAKNPGESNPVATLTDALPPGAIFHTAGPNAPDGPGDGSTTFNVPDLRGEFLRGVDDGRGVDTGRAIGSAQLDALQNIVGQLYPRGASVAGGLGAIGGSNGVFGTVALGGGGAGTTASSLQLTSPTNRDLVTFNANNVVRTAAETRPRNIALLACIKY